MTLTGISSTKQVGNIAMLSCVLAHRCRFLRNVDAIGIVLLLSVGSVFADLDERTVRLAPNDLVIVTHGESVYKAHCASCHGANLEGQPDWRKRDASGLLPAPPHDASGHTWHHDDDLLFEIVKFGPAAVIGDSDYASTMPAYKQLLSDDDIVAVLSYIANSWPEEEREWQREVNTSRFGADTSPEKKGLLEKLFR